jgi:two-component system, response regulator PdtaR
MINLKQNNRILIVEDDAFQALLVEKLITKLGYVCIGNAKTGEKAIEMALDLNPDIILMDIALEGEMDGITAVQEIKKVKEIPVIYITGNSDSYNLDRAEKTGFVDYLIKPISGSLLKDPLLRAGQLVGDNK